jgi:hypothetical protein
MCREEQLWSFRSCLLGGGFWTGLNKTNCSNRLTLRPPIAPFVFCTAGLMYVGYKEQLESTTGGGWSRLDFGC